MSITPTPLADRLWARVVQQDDGCWLWTGATSGGYGRIQDQHPSRRLCQTHRVAYELLVGPVPEGMRLDHLCRVRHCVNPSHLEPVTDRENILRGVGHAALNARKTHCHKGHEFTPENTYLHASGNRDCRACRRDRGRARRSAA